MKTSPSLTCLMISTMLLLACGPKSLIDVTNGAHEYSRMDERFPMTPKILFNYTKETDSLTIVNLWSDARVLFLEVAYAGGCEKHDFDLITDGIRMKSLPPKQLFFLKHDANGDACEAIIQETLAFDMTSMRTGNTTELVVLLMDTDKQVTIHF